MASPAKRGRVDGPSSPELIPELSLPKRLHSMQSHSSGALCEEPMTTYFRISGIPSDWDRNNLARELKNVDPELNLGTTELSELFPDRDEPTLFQVALLNMGRCTAYLSNIQPGKPHCETIRWRGDNVKGAMRKIWLYIDKDFHDLTPLNRAIEPIAGDVIAVTDLGGHAIESWRSRAPMGRSIDRPIWLRDFLPERIPNVRIMTYGYDSSLGSTNGTNLTDYRRNFKQCLHNARRTCQTLIGSHLDRRHRDIRDCIQGLFLFGTPHQGLAAEHLHHMVAGGNSKALLAQLEEGSEFLENQKETLSQIWDDYKGKVVTFYETAQTKQIIQFGPEELKREVKTNPIVKRLSAQLNLPREISFPTHSSHTDMVKFESPQDKVFQTVVTQLRECLGVIKVTELGMYEPED